MNKDNKYPYGNPISIDIFPLTERPTGQDIEKMIAESSMIDAAVLQKYSIALHETECQVRDMQLKYPFIPESFGFQEEVPSEGKHYVHPDGIVTLTRVKESFWIIDYSKFNISLGEGMYEIMEIANKSYVNIDSAEAAKKIFEYLGISEYVGKRGKTILDEEGTEKIGEPIEIVLKNKIVEMPNQQESKEENQNTLS